MWKPVRHAPQIAGSKQSRGLLSVENFPRCIIIVDITSKAFAARFIQRDRPFCTKNAVHRKMHIQIRLFGFLKSRVRRKRSHENDHKESFLVVHCPDNMSLHWIRANPIPI